MAKKDSESSDATQVPASEAPPLGGLATSGGFGGGNQSLLDGMRYDADGNMIVPEVRVPDGAEIVQQDQIGVYRRTVFSNGAVEVVQTEPAKPGDGVTIVTPVPLPGEQQDVAGTGQDAVTKPKTA